MPKWLCAALTVLAIGGGSLQIAAAADNPATRAKVVHHSSLAAKSQALGGDGY